MNPRCSLMDLGPMHYLGVVGKNPGEGQRFTFGIHLNPFLGWLKRVGF